MSLPEAEKRQLDEDGYLALPDFIDPGLLARLRQLPQQALADPLADHPRQVLVAGTAGTVVVLNAHLWHAGTANRTSCPRTALHAFYCRRDKPQQQYQKKLLRPGVQQTLPG